VTIAAGYRFDTGILLCADSQYTGAAKTNESKIFPIQHHAATVVLVLTGRSTFGRRAFERIRDGILTIPEDQVTRGRMQDAIEAALRDVFNNHIYTHPDWGRSNAPEVSFVIGLYSPIDGDFLFSTDETICAEMPDHVCLGSGSYLGDFLSRMYRGREQLFREVVDLAIYILQQTKSYDAYCGGNSEFIVLWDDGDISPIQNLDVTLGEAYSQAFMQCVSSLFYSAANLEKTDDAVSRDMKRDIDTLVRNRETRKNIRDQYNEWMGLLHTRAGDILGGQKSRTIKSEPSE
jgi:20S proteasome alpha/beta subunit